MGLHAYHLIPTRSPGLYRWAVALRNRRRRQGRDTADACRAGRKRRSRDEGLITLRLGRVTGLAGTRKGVAVRVGCRKAIRECLHEGNDLVFLMVRQAEITGRHIDIVRHLWHRPAVYFFGRS